MTSNAFASLHLPDDFLNNLQSLDYLEMTPIQAQTLPHLLAGKDIQAQAKTGSGKTAAFAIALLQQIDTRDYWTQALVLCPTRELADQVSKEIRRLARSVANTRILTLCGGTAIELSSGTRGRAANCRPTAGWIAGRATGCAVKRSRSTCSRFSNISYNKYCNTIFFQKGF